MTKGPYLDGQLLIAMPGMSDQHFDRSVIYMCAHSEQGAMGEWSRLVGTNKDALGGLTPSVARVDLGEKGVYFRLRAGPLADRAAAESLCATLSAQNVGCIVVRP